MQEDRRQTQTTGGTMNHPLKQSHKKFLKAMKEKFEVEQHDDVWEHPVVDYPGLREIHPTLICWGKP